MNDFKPNSNISEYLPELYEGIRDFVEIMDSEEPSLADAADALEQVHKNFFVNHMDSDALEEWEHLYGLYTASGDPITVRRQRIISRLALRPPYTVGKVKQTLNDLCGTGNYSVTVNGAAYTVSIRIGLSVQETYDDVVSILHQIAPAHIILDIDIMYNTHAVLAEFTHAELSAYTHAQLKEEELE